MPNINLFRGNLNIIGVFWFCFLFYYSFSKFRKSKFHVVTTIAISAALVLLVHYSLDEMDVLIRWSIIGFDYPLFLNKYNVYVSIPIAFYVVHRFAKSNFDMKQNRIYIALAVIMFWDAIFAFANIEFRLMEGFEKALCFWTIYMTAKVIWTAFFLAIWKKEPDAMSDYRKIHGTGEAYMMMAMNRITEKIAKKFKDNFGVAMASNSDNIGKHFGYLETIKQIHHGDFRDIFCTLEELEEQSKVVGYEILKKGYFDNPPWFDMPARKKPFPIPMWVLRRLLFLEHFGNRYTSHHVYAVRRKIDGKTN